MTAPRWRDPLLLARHFLDHGAEVGASDVQAYKASSLETIHVGQRFEYLDQSTGDPRVGYFDVATGRLTALSGDERTIRTHFVPTRGEAYVRGLPRSTYL